MGLAQVSQFLSGTAASESLRTATWAIPSIQVVHILALAVLFASALMLDLRVLGTGLRDESLRLVAARFLPPIWICLLFLLGSGSLLIVAEPGRTIGNPVFYLKMTLLVIAIIVTLALRSFSAGASAVAPTHRMLAALSLLLWICIIVAGRYIAYIDAF